MTERFKASELFFIGGITGTGKTTITKEIAKANGDVQAVFGSRALMEHFDCASYDELNRIPAEKQRQGRITIFSDLRTRKADKILLDGHYVLFTKAGEMTPTVESEWIQQFDKLIHLISDPYIILERLIADPENFERRLVNLAHINGPIIERIRRTQELSVQNAEKISLSIGLPLCLVNNSFEISAPVNEVTQIIYSG